MRRSCEPLVGRVFLRILGSIRAARISAVETLGSGAAILLLAALAARREQNAAVVDELLAGQAAQAISGCDRQAGIERQEKPQLHGARHFVDVLAAGARGADEFPFQFIVGDDDVRGDLERHDSRCSRAPEARCARRFRAAPSEW